MNSDSRELSKEEFIEKVRDVCSRGWIESHRKPSNDGAVGNTLEDILNIRENNEPFANTKHWELKSKAKSKSSMLTMFHLDPWPREPRSVEAVLLLPIYGWPHKKKLGQMSFRSTTSAQRYTDRGFTISVDDSAKRVLFSFDSSRVDSKHSEWLERIRQEVGTGQISPQPYWTFDKLEDKSVTKLKNSLLVLAEVKSAKGVYYYKYTELYILESFKFDRFMKGLKEGLVLVDFDASTKHRHGTKFRTKSSDFFISLFEHSSKAV
ncbi:MvaI/BcnI restriction endonuclease family protein [bacterium]|nr:MvaI/BcnI restriction endonuclease family protein [bacterium]